MEFEELQVGNTFPATAHMTVRWDLWVWLRVDECDEFLAVDWAAEKYFRWQSIDLLVTTNQFGRWVGLANLSFSYRTA